MHRDTRTTAARAVLLVLAGALCALPGVAQDVFSEAPGNSVLVSLTNSAADFTEIQPAIDEAVFRARSKREHHTVWVEAGEYEAPDGLWIPADADITLRGISPGVTGPVGSAPGSRPWRIIIDGGGIGPDDGVINIHTGDPAAPQENFLWQPGDDELELTRVQIQGLTVRNGAYGVRIEGTDEISLPPVRATLSRLVILGTAPMASRAGVLVENNAAPLIANCSIGGYNDASSADAWNSRVGVHVKRPADLTGGFFTDILHCTILLNEDYGVYVEEDADARVRNSIIYRNGDDNTDLNFLTAPEGGIVWEVDPFINPKIAPYNTNPADATRVPVTITGSGLVDSAGPTLVFFGPMDFGFYRSKPATLANPDLPDWPTDGAGDKQVPLTLWYPAVSGDYELVDNGDGTQTLSGLVPPSYLNGPGAVDVTILRGDGFVQTVRAAFTYTWDGAAADGPTPEVFSVSPERGPAFPPNVIDLTARRGMWVHIYGARFEPGCEVFFDTTGGLLTDPAADGDWQDTDAKSERVQWLSPTTLYAKVPEVPEGFVLPSGKIDVFVRNVDTNQVSPAGQTQEFEYIDPANNPYYDGVRPAIAQISPNFYRDLDVGDETDPVLINIVGWNFGPGPGPADGTQPDPVVVKIGGITCPYDAILPYDPTAAFESTSGLFQGEDDANGDSFDEIRGIVVPVAAFGAGGTYDVEVINTDGQFDVYPNGFTYYADSRPREDASTRFPWRPANFVEANVGGERTLLASGLDTGIIYRLIDPLADLTKWVPGDNAPPAVPPQSIITPDASVEEHLSHTQREIRFNLGGTAADLLPGLGSTSNLFQIEIDNARDAQGRDTWTATRLKTVASEFALAKNANDLSEIADGETLFFSLGEVEMVDGLRNGFIRPTDVAEGSPEADYVARVRVTNYKPDHHTAVLGETDITSVLLVGDWLYFNYPTLSEGAYGPQDVALELPEDSAWNKLGLALNPTNESFPMATYYVSETRAWRPRLNGDALARPDLRNASPRIVPETGGVEITLTGADFVGPFVPEDVPGVGTDFSIQDLNWDFTRVSVVHDDTDFDPTNESESIAILVGPGTDPAVTAYEVVSDTEIRLTLADLTVTTNPLATFPRNTPLDLMVEQVDRFGTVLTAADGTTPLRYILHDALVITSGPMPPTVTDVYRYGTGANPERWGVVKGGDLVAIEGVGFWPTDPVMNPGYPTVPTVRFGDVEARVITPDDTVTIEDGAGGVQVVTAPSLAVGAGADCELLVVTPPALRGMPGLTNVYVTARQDVGGQWELTGVTPPNRRFLYINDGAPVLDAVEPNFVSREESDAVDGTFIDTPGSEAEDYIGKDGLYLTFRGLNFDDTVQLLLYVDEDGDGWPDDLDGDNEIDATDYLVVDVDDSSLLAEYYTESPYELLVKAPAAAELLDRMGLPDDPFENGYGAGAGNVPGIVRLWARVRNKPATPAWYDDGGDPNNTPEFSRDWTVDDLAANAGDLFRDNVTSNAVEVFYYDDYAPNGIEPSVAVLQFNDVWMNRRDYVNVGAGVGSISVDPLIDPGPTTVHAPGPKMVVADEGNWWLGKLAQGFKGQNPVRDKAGDFPMPPHSGEDLELDGRPNGPPSSDDARVIQGAGRTGEAKPEIGADELPLAEYDLSWYYAGITPFVLGRNNPDFEIEIRIRGLSAPLTSDVDGAGGIIGLPVNERVFILPQGAINDALLHLMPESPSVDDIRAYLLPRAIQCDLRRLEGDTYLAKPNHIVETVLYRPNSIGPGGIRLPGGDARPGDVIADGHAAVFIVMPPNMAQRGGSGDTLLGMVPPENGLIEDLTDEHRIVEQAVTGRHFLVDTIPPRIFLEAGDGSGGFFYGQRDETEISRPAADAWELVFPIEGWPSFDPVNTNFDDIFAINLTPRPLVFGGANLHTFPPVPVVTDQGSHHYTPADNGLLFNIAPTDAQLPGFANGVLARLINPAGLLVPPVTARPPVGLYFNKASVSNAQYDDDVTTDNNNLSFQLRALFVDPPAGLVPDAFPNLATGGLFPDRVINEAVAGNIADRDSYTANHATRQVSGFFDVQLVLTANTTEEARRAVRALNGLADDPTDVPFEYLGAQWRFEGDSRVNMENASPDVTINFTPRGMGVDDPAWHPTLAGDIAANTGFNRNFIRSTANVPNNVLDAAWDITGLSWNHIYDLMNAERAWNVSFKLVARDLAGNASTFDIDPLNLWWMLQMRTEFVRDPGWDARTNEPVFRWAPVRNHDPDPTYGPSPIYTYTVFVERNAFGVPEDLRKFGPYEQSPEGWQFWSRSDEVDASLFRRTLEAMGLSPDGGEHHMILVVQGADEAGNVEPWPTRVVEGYGPLMNGNFGDELLPATSATGGTILNFHDTGFAGQTLTQEQVERMREWAFDDDTTQRKLRNWHRFMWRGVNKPDTIVSRIVPTFWYGNVTGALREGETTNLPAGQVERRLGPNPRIAMPSEGSGLKVEAEFLVESEYSALGADERLMVAWQLFEDGVRVSPPLNAADPYHYIDPANGFQNPVQLPWFFTFSAYTYAYPDYDGYNVSDRPGDLGDHERQRPVRYTFRAATFVDRLTAGTTGAYDTGEKIDPTWENVTFVITPISSEERIFPGDQPILETDDR